MKNAMCMHPDFRQLLSTVAFEMLPVEKVKLYRNSLFCPECGAVSFYRKKTIDGKSSCFGSRYHMPNCTELSVKNNNSEPEVYEILDVIKKDGIIEIPLGSRSSKATARFPGSQIQNHTSLPNIEPIYHCTPKDILASLLRHDGLESSNVMVMLASGFVWKARNLFVNIVDAQPNNKPKVFWGVISHANKKNDWLNFSGRDNIGLPLSLYKEVLLERHSVSDASAFNGMAVLVFGLCFSNKNEDRFFIKPWNNDVSNIYLAEW